MKKINGFTLAEVLITLAILGVVAALTLPVLVTNIEKNSWITGLKNGKSNLDRAFAQMLAENNTDTLDEVPLWEDSSKQDSEMRRYFKIDKIGSGRDEKIYKPDYSVTTELSGIKRYTLPNMSILNVTFHDATHNDGESTEGKKNCSDILKAGGNICENYASIYLDVNGKKGPNTIGKDIFYFYLSREGKLFPFGGDDINIFDGSTKWNSEAGCKGNLNNIKDPKTCTARVIDNEYDMDY